MLRVGNQQASSRKWIESKSASFILTRRRTACPANATDLGKHKKTSQLRRTKCRHAVSTIRCPFRRAQGGPHVLDTFQHSQSDLVAFRLMEHGSRSAPSTQHGGGHTSQLTAPAVCRFLSNREDGRATPD